MMLLCKARLLCLLKHKRYNCTIARCFNFFLKDCHATDSNVLHSHVRQISLSAMGVNKTVISAYANYLLKMYHDVASRMQTKALNQAFDCPPLLYDELGGKSHLAIERLRNLSLVAEELEEKEGQIKELSALAEDSNGETELLHEVDNEIKGLKEGVSALQESFIDILIDDKELEACDGAILEVRAGVGGAEAMLFANEIYEMYMHFCNRHGFEVKAIDSESEDKGGMLKASCIIASSDGFAYRLLRHEAGVHRVQRVPKTETRGRMHTSTVSVAVIPKHDTSTFAIDPNDIKKHFTCSPGGGGQHVNKTLSCALVRHVPTGIQVRCHATRIQLENLNRAMEQLKQILYKRYLDEKLSKTNEIRRQQIRNRERSDKIRTYNFHNNRVTDHRIGYTVHDVQSFLSAGPAFLSMLRELDEKYRSDEKTAVFNALIKEVNIDT